MAINNTYKKPDYNDLQKSIDKLIGKFGLEQTLYIIETFSDNTGRHKDIHKRRLIEDYIIGEAIQIFNLDKSRFFKSERQKYREARMACYHLLDKYTGSTHREIAKALGRKRGSAIYFIQKCSEILSIPNGHHAFVAKYKALDSNIIGFFSKLK